MIATDPPFNKGRDFHATPDSLAKGAKFQDRWSWANDVEQAWVDAIEDGAPGVLAVIEAARGQEVKPGKREGDDMGAFLCFMAVRLLEMRRVLKDTGSIYLHCDPTADYYLRALMDAIFGRDNFRNAIVWQRNDGRGKGSQHKARAWGANTDTILFYVKSRSAELRPYRELTSDEIEDKFPLRDKDGRRYYTGIPIFCSKSMGARPNLCFEWRGFVNPHPSGWRLSKTRLEEEYRKGNVVIRDDGKLERRKYLEDYEGAPMDNCWIDVPRLTDGKEKIGYPTQKPLALYERIIAASSNPGDMVLDPFAGCATTPVAAERLGRQWVGMDLWDKAHKTVTERIQKEVRLENPDARLDYRVRLVTEPPVRTDGGEVAAPYLQVTERYDIPYDGSPRTRAAQLEYLLAQHGPRCQGCDREFDDPRYLQIDHNAPRTDGGSDHITNRVLLCGPCNLLKGAAYTLTGLRRENAKQGYMAKGATR